VSTRGDDRHLAMRLLEAVAATSAMRCVVVDGEPPAKGRPRWGKGRTYTPKRTVDGELRLAAGFVGLPMYPSNVAVACVFRRSTRRRVDVDNLLKAVLDAGTAARLWRDDAQVTALVGVLEHDAADPRVTVALGVHTSTLTR
jgi:hypothetical protein